MTLRQFLTVTAEIGDQDVRPALAHALKKEVPKSRQSHARFYRQVVEELTMSGALARVEHVPPTGVRRVLAVVGNRRTAQTDVARGPTTTRTANALVSCV